MDMMIAARKFGARIARRDLADFLANREIVELDNEWSEVHINALADHLGMPVASLPGDIICEAAEAYEAEMDRLMEPNAQIMDRRL